MIYLAKQTIYHYLYGQTAFSHQNNGRMYLLVVEENQINSSVCEDTKLMSEITAQNQSMRRWCHGSYHRLKDPV